MEKPHDAPEPVINADAEGIDIGAKAHLVAVPCDRDRQLAMVCRRHGCSNVLETAPEGALRKK